MTGQTPLELIDPGCPALVEHVWFWFLDLSRSRGGSGFGANALSFSEIAAWCALSGERPSPYEVELIRALDGLFMTPPEVRNKADP